MHKSMVLCIKITLMQKQVKIKGDKHDLWICSSEHTGSEC